MTGVCTRCQDVVISCNLLPVQSLIRPHTRSSSLTNPTLPQV